MPQAKSVLPTSMTVELFPCLYFDPWVFLLSFFLFFAHPAGGEERGAVQALGASQVKPITLARARDQLLTQVEWLCGAYTFKLVFLYLHPMGRREQTWQCTIHQLYIKRKGCWEAGVHEAELHVTLVLLGLSGLAHEQRFLLCLSKEQPEGS